MYPFSDTGWITDAELIERYVGDRRHMRDDSG